MARRKTPKLPPVHPGEVLLADFLEPLALSQYRLTHDTSVPPRRINEIVHGTRAITADTALRLARFFGTTERFWLNLQARYETATEHIAGAAGVVTGAPLAVTRDPLHPLLPCREIVRQPIVAWVLSPRRGARRS